MHIPAAVLELIPAVLAPLITALAAALTFLVRDWTLRRNAHGRRTRAIEQATKHVEFIHVWLDAYGKSSSPAEQNGGLLVRAMHDLEQAYEAVTAAAAQPPVERRELKRTAQDVLLRSVHSAGARVARGFYYAALVVFALLMCFFAVVGAALTRDGEYATGIGLILVTAVVTALPALLLRSLACYLEGRAGSAVRGADPATRSLQPVPAPLDRSTHGAGGHRGADAAGWGGTSTYRADPRRP